MKIWKWNILDSKFSHRMGGSDVWFPKGYRQLIASSLRIFVFWMSWVDTWRNSRKSRLLSWLEPENCEQNLIYSQKMRNHAMLEWSYPNIPTDLESWIIPDHILKIVPFHVEFRNFPPNFPNHFIFPCHRSRCRSCWSRSTKSSLGWMRHTWGMKKHNAGKIDVKSCAK